MEQEQSNKIDFSSIREDHTGKAIRRLIILRNIKNFLVFFLTISVIWIAFFAPKLKAAYDDGMFAKAKLEEAQHLIINRDFENGALKLTESNRALMSSQEAFSKVYGIRWIPFIGSQVKAVDKLLIAGVNLTSSGAQMVALMDDVTKEIRNETLPFSELSVAHKKKILGKLVEAQPLLENVQKEITNAEVAISSIKVDKLIKPLSEVVTPLQKYLPIMKGMVAQVVPMITVMPQVVGFDVQKNYLFLLQNTHELRPTGGFIGTFGILKIKDGSIIDFKTDNIYNLDKAFADDKLVLTPQQVLDMPSPEPITRYLEQRQWSLRDSNWDPDFPTTAQTSLDIWKKENEIAADIEKQRFLRDPKNRSKVFETTFPQESIDGVIGVTPELIEGLLKLTGPITVDGIRFTSENVQDELEYRVGYEFRELGIDEKDRKEIVRRLADQIQGKLLALPISKLADVAQIGMESLSSRQVMIWMNEPTLQSLVTARGWAGEIRSGSSDYLMVVDSNLGSLKSDQFVKRYVDYTLEKQGDKYIGKVSVTHVHEGEFAWNSTRLRSFTRIYVPEGSKLISSTGAMYDDKTRDPDGKAGEIVTTQEHGKTVFGGFFVTEPKERNTLTFTYELPDSVATAINKGAYSLLFQKQAGSNPYLTVQLDFDKTIRNTSPLNLQEGVFSSEYSHRFEINKDEEITLGF